MLILIALLLAPIASHRVTESVEDLPPEAFNTTILLPVSSTTSTNVTDNGKASSQKTRVEATTWKLETAFGESQIEEEEDKNETSTTTSTPTQQNKSNNASSEFRPSPHLGTFIEDYSLEITPTKATLGDFRPLKKPPSAFVKYPKDFKSSFYHSKGIFKQNQFPYKLEPSIVTRAKNTWRPSDLESKPTMESPMRLPAGSLYKAPDPFKDKPVSDDEDFGLAFDDLKENNNADIKKRVNPWKQLLRLVTAFIPVGIIISALTPNVITVQSTGPGIDNGYPTPLFRRSDSSLAELSAISEPCRRRLLCELHADYNYQQSGQTKPRRRQCYRLRCEDPEALSKMLEWLLSHQPGDQRGRQFT